MTPWLDDGDVQLYHGDCREVLPQLAGLNARLVWTDPPYGLDFNRNDLASRREAALGLGANGSARPIMGDAPDDFVPLMAEVLQLLAPVTDPCCCCCCCCCGGGGGPRPRFAHLSLLMDAKPWQFHHAVVWHKEGAGLGWQYRRDYELILSAGKRGARVPWHGEPTSNVIRTYRPKSIEANGDHPTPKPIGLIERFILKHTEPGDVVLDPFMGSGPVAVAARNLGRRFVGVELEERWLIKAAERLGQQSLLSPALAPAGDVS